MALNVNFNWWENRAFFLSPPCERERTPRGCCEAQEDDEVEGSPVVVATATEVARGGQWRWSELQPIEQEGRGAAAMLPVAWWRASVHALVHDEVEAGVRAVGSRRAVCKWVEVRL
jgi:hypothetical protein